MKYSILINQKAAVASFDCVDLVDMAILNYIQDFSQSESIMKIFYEGKCYYWIDYNHLINQMPLLSNKKGKAPDKSTIYKRLKDLTNQSILILHPNSKILGKSLYAFGKKWESYISSSGNSSVPSEINHITIGNKSVPPSEIVQNYNTIKDNTINNNKSKEVELPFSSSSFSDKWKEWKEYKKTEFRFSYKSTISEASALSKLSNIAGNNESNAIDIINEAMANGYKGFFALNTKNDLRTNGTVKAKAPAMHRKESDSGTFGGLDIQSITNSIKAS